MQNKVAIEEHFAFPEAPGDSARYDATRRWFFEASEFLNEPVREPLLTAKPQTVEDYFGLD